jgi:DUF2934 family protein
VKDRDEQIRYRAYLIWLATGKPEGRDKEHWKEAESIVDQIPGIVPNQRPPVDAPVTVSGK